MAPIQPPASDMDSPFYIERISQYVSLPPASLTSPLPSICANVFSPMLLTYFPPVKGVVLAYEKVRLSDEAPESKIEAGKKKRRHRAQDESEATDEGSSNGGTVLLRQIDEYTSPFVWATASLLVWRPTEGQWISATVTHQSETHITLSHLNTFPISILKKDLPADWSWNSEEQGRKKKGWDGRVADEGGWWIDGDGEKVGGEAEGLEKKAELRVRIKEWDARGGMGKGRGGMKIEGSLLTVEEEKRLAEKGKGRADGARTTEAMEVD